MAQISQKTIHSSVRKKTPTVSAAGAVSSATAAARPVLSAKKPNMTAPTASAATAGGGAQGQTLPQLPQSGVATAQTTLRKPTSQYDFIKALYDAQQESALKALEAAYAQNVMDLDALKESTQAQYRAARDQTAASAAVNRAGWNEYALASGLGSGAAGQAQLALGNQLTGELSALRSAEAGALLDIETRREKAGAQYRAEVAQAIADGNYKRANALYEEALRLDKALTALSEAQADENYRALNAAITLAKNGMTLTPKTSLADAGAESLFSQLLRLGADESSAQRHLTGLGYTQQTASALAADYAAWQKAQVKA